MDQNIAINTEVLENKIELLKSQRDRIKEVFDTQDKTIDERINFLQKIVDSYKKADVTISNKIDSNVDIGA